MCFDHIYPFPSMSLISTHTPITHPIYYLLLFNPLSSICAVCIFLDVCYLLKGSQFTRGHTLKGNRLSLSQQLPKANGSLCEVELHALHARSSSGLSLHKSYVWCHMCSGFLCATAPLCLENSFLVAIHCVWCLQSFCSFIHDNLGALKRASVIRDVLFSAEHSIIS